MDCLWAIKVHCHYNNHWRQSLCLSDKRLMLRSILCKLEIKCMVLLIYSALVHVNKQLHCQWLVLIHGVPIPNIKIHGYLRIPHSADVNLCFCDLLWYCGELVTNQPNLWAKAMLSLYPLIDWVIALALSLLFVCSHKHEHFGRTNLLCILMSSIYCIWPGNKSPLCTSRSRQSFEELKKLLCWKYLLTVYLFQSVTIFTRV